MPIGVPVEVDLAARAHAVDAVARPCARRPLRARTVHAVRDDVQFQRLAARVVRADGVAPTQRSLAAAEHEHHVLAGLIAEVVEPGACQADAPHARAEIAHVGHLELQRAHARD